MDSNNWRAAQAQAQPPVQNGASNGTGAAMDTGDWRVQLQPGSRPRIVNKILETLRRHLPFSGQEGLQELKNIAERFENTIYTGATSQSDYLRKISLKMLAMEANSRSSMTNTIPTSNANGSVNPSDSVILVDGPANGIGATTETGDWRSKLQNDSRQKNVIKIMEALQRSLPFSGQEALQEIKEVAEIVEGQIFGAATSQSDYLRRISVKMLFMETKSQIRHGGTMQTNNVNVSKTATDSVIDAVGNEAATGTGDAIDTSNWRTQLQPDTRQIFVNKIIETLKRHLRFSEHERLQDLKIVAEKFEGKIYNGATSWSDYLRKISLKMLNMQRRSQ